MTTNTKETTRVAEKVVIESGSEELGKSWGGQLRNIIQEKIVGNREGGKISYVV